jgi:TolB-like protein/cytochrome c-type biogenesis protein CcmH/NrfG
MGLQKKIEQDGTLPLRMKAISRKEIVGQLDRILSSPQISGSVVLSEFLRFVVQEAIDGRGDELKEYTIGVNALRRDVDFNPQIDSIVRIHAGRLRRAVKEYYYEVGTSDPIVISIPKGSYQPSFERRTPESVRMLAEPEERENGHTKQKQKEALALSEEKSAANNGTESDIPHKTTVAVLPFKRIGLDEMLDNFCQGMGEYLSTELTRFNDFRVISYYQGAFISTQLTDMRHLGAALHARYIITGSVQLLRPVVRVLVQLNDSNTGDQLWAHTFDHPYTPELISTFQEEVVDKVLAGIAGVNGAISRSELTAVQNRHSEININYWFTRYTNSFDEKTMTLARRYYEGALKRDPNNAQILGFLAEILAGESMLPSTKDKSLERSIAYAKLAIKLDPSSQQGYQALAIALLLQRKKNESAEILKQGLAVNPKSADFQGGMGAVLIFAGEFELGAPIVKRAMELTPNLPWWQVFSLSFYYYQRKDYQEALYLISRMQVEMIWIPIIKAACYAELGQVDDAKAILRHLKTLFPTVDLSQPGALNQFFYSEAIVHELSSGLKKVL